MQRRRSKKREQILEVLETAHCALSAADIHTRLPAIDLTTVYRNLELFVEDGLVKKLDLDAGEAMYEFKEENHHHAICTDCDKVIHFHVSDEAILEIVDIPDFQPESLELTVRGRCRH